ncbi:hypothetical protein GCM10011348_21840 [Marinobacterium nitratireducens]|uniref:D-isomer specific 2-hydroxyacid dehydrogenase catalytic domain-containing protein n=1 Tax=Marinobacterium nitratireducens TaxID=518897 RepID=A0A917ZF35_9GAMM|nr:hypothetical protein [Marinobacterium nitratireducens]GGO81861.1 hypothetical protein GCM10011348_21840 [Marinobacterium nitratireducens]
MHQQTHIALSPTLPPEFAGPLAMLGHLTVACREVTNGTRVYACTAEDLVDENLISRLPSSLELIAIAGSETAHVDLEAARARGIKVSNIPLAARDTALSLKANIAAFIDRGFPLNGVRAPEQDNL